MTESPLASWTNGFAKLAILDFVARVTAEGGADFVPPAQRIAVFDNDGTLWCEQPMQVQGFFLVDRVKQLAADYRDKGVTLVAINPNDPKAVHLSEMGHTDLGDTLPEMKIRAAFRGFTFPFLSDGATQEVALKYGPTATPHIFLFDQQPSFFQRSSRVFACEGRENSLLFLLGQPDQHDGAIPEEGRIAPALPKAIRRSRNDALVAGAVDGKPIADEDSVRARNHSLRWKGHCCRRAFRHSEC